MSTPGKTIEELVEEYLARRRRGDQVDAASFAAGHSHLETELRDALESIEALELTRSERASRDLELQDRVGAFRLVREVGRGGMGVVFEAIEEPLGRRVALKLLPGDQLVESSARARFRREAELASRLDHSGICTVYAAGVEGDRPWIAMRFVEGETLARKIARALEQHERGLSLAGAKASGRANAQSVAACLARVARALEFAHERGVVHRDVKPSNVMVAPTGDPILLDFGLAREEEDTTALTRTGETAGTPAYIAPELIDGEIVKPDARCDVYALGVTAYECLALRLPFRAPTRAALYRMILGGAPLDLVRIDPAVPRDLAVVVATAMERDRTRRYATAADVAADLEAVSEGRPIAARPVSSAGRVLRWARREPGQALLAGLFATAFLGLALAGGFLWASQDEVLAAERAELAQEIEDLLVNGYAEVDLRRWPEAETCFLRVLALKPDDVEALAGRILVLNELGRKTEALELLAHAPPVRVFEMLRGMIEGGSSETTNEEWMQEASSLDLFFDGLRLKWRAEKLPPSERPAVYHRAIERFEEASLRSSNNRAVFHLYRASAAYRAGDISAARSAAATLTALWPESSRALAFAGTALSLSDANAGRALLEQAAELDPEGGGIFQTLGMVCYSLGDHAAAERAFRRAIELDPRDDSAHNGLGVTLDFLGRDDEARLAYTAALSISPKTEIFVNLGVLEIDAERYEAARNCLARALEIDPENSEIRSAYALALYHLGDLDAAHENYALALEQQPEFLNAWIGISETLLELGWPEEALLRAEEGLAMHPSSEALAILRERARDALERDE